MKAVSASALLLAAALLAGCGQLRVAVDVLDPQHVRNEIVEEGQRQLYRQIVAAQPGDLAARVDRNFKDYQREMLVLVMKYEALAKKFPPAPASVLNNAAADLRQSVSTGSIVEDAARHGTEIERQAQDIRALGARIAWSGRGTLPAELRDKLATLAAEEKKLGVVQQRDVRELAASARQIAARVAQPAPGAAAAADTRSETQAIQTQEAVVTAVAQRSIIQDASIAHTEYAYVVASAPPALWSPNYNQAFASGTLGNVDIVIRLNSLADFSVKGMLFDASKVAQVASKVMTQSLLIGVQMSGVPVAGTSTSGGNTAGGDALSKSSGELASLEGSLARRQALTDAQRDAIRATARTILGSAPALEAEPLKARPASDAGRTALHQSIDATIGALRPLLVMQELQ